MFQHFEKNAKGRDFVVGDIHGMFDALGELLSVVEFDPHKDRLFSVGDLVDRGPLSRDAADWIKQPWFHAIRGNHDDMLMLAGTDNIDIQLHVINGGTWWYARTDKEKDALVKAMSTLPIAIEIDTDDGTVGLVHAEVPFSDWTQFKEALQNPGENIDHFLHYAMWSRHLIRGLIADFEGVSGVDTVIVGHSVVPEVTSIKNVMYVDTGAVYGKRMTLVQIQGGSNIYELDTSSFGYDREKNEYVNKKIAENKL